MEQLIQQFLNRYLCRKDIIHRLPVSLPISEFWPMLQNARAQQSIELPLRDSEGNAFRFVLNTSIERQCDSVAALARKDTIFETGALEHMIDDAVIDEAIFSSLIEGAFTSREAAVGFIRKHKEPTNKSEQMVKNNYDALTYVLEHLEYDITDKTIIDIAAIVTRNAAEEQVNGYRKGKVYVMGREEIVYTPPEAEYVPDMMNSLIRFIGDYDLHPVLKACIAHFYFVYVHPFGDGNGRTARALSYMMLLKSGYEFFRYFSISSLVAKERGRYYKAIRNVEEDPGDMTYFIDFYSDMLSRSVAEMEKHLTHHVLADQRLRELEKAGALNKRQMDGAKWLLTGDSERITVETWRKKFKVTTETARRDLLTLCEQGLLLRQMEGRKAVFHINRQYK